MSPTTPHVAGGRTQHADGGTVVESEPEIQDILDALDDSDCRTILATTDGEALSASEVSERCEMPLSTAYRKLDTLVEVGLVEERTRIRSSGKHPSEYTCIVDDIDVSIGTDGVTVEVSHRENYDIFRREAEI